LCSIEISNETEDWRGKDIIQPATAQFTNLAASMNFADATDNRSGQYA
jgi:hypothetical protein